MNHKSSLTVLFCLFTGLLFAQKGVITGKVTTSENGTPLEGVAIVASGSQKGVVSKTDGTYSITIGNEKSLVFSYVGFESQTIQIKVGKPINIALVPVVNNNTEVVVIGYGSQKRADVTGAISKYKNEKLDEAPVSSLAQALQGKIAGVSIQNISAQAGDAPKIRIRGLSSVNAGASPLVVVDGMPVADGLSFVNPSDVESIEVLKDAASAAIYGSRGASGVILITTKAGKSEKTKYQFKYSNGSKTAYKRYDILTTSEYVKSLFDEAALKATDPSIVPPTGVGIAGDGDRAAYVIENTLMNGPDDYQSRSLRTGNFKNISLSASGGKQDVRYFISGQYINDEGMMIKSNYERFSIRSKVDIQFSKKAKLSLNINPSTDMKLSPSENFTNFTRFPSYLGVRHTAASAAWVRQNPQWGNIVEGDWADPRHFAKLLYGGKMPDGSVWQETVAQGPQDGSSQNNPYHSTMEQDIYNKSYRLQTSSDFNYSILPSLDFRSMSSLYMKTENGLNWANRDASGDGIVNKGVYTNTSFIDLLTENTLNWKKNVNNHSFNLLAGFSGQKTNTSSDRVTGLDFPSDNIRTLNTAATIDKAGTFGTKNQIGLLSYFGRFIYGYDGKYLLSASFRRDGSSYFGPGNKWGDFPAVSIGWVASKEKFLKDITWLNKLKFRASNGVSGNNRILDYGFVDLLYPGSYSFGAGNGSLVSGQVSSPSILANSNITWERTRQKNFGVDLVVLNNKFTLSLDVYNSQTERLLLQQSAMAFTGVPQFWNNIGSLENKGMELEITTKNVTNKDFSWVTYFNISKTQNKVLELGAEAYLLNYGERNEIYLNKVGNPLVQYFGFKTDGVWLSQAQIDAAKLSGITSNLTALFTPGGLKLVDLNGDKVIDNNDRTVIGSPYPDFTWGITNEFTYKNFDFSFTFQGVQGGQIINGDPNYAELLKTNRSYTANHWLSPAFPGDGKTPYQKTGFSMLLTDYVVEDASYQSLRDLRIGYRLPSAASKIAGINSMRVFFSAQNLLFLTAKGYRGLNPEGLSNNGPYGSPLIDGYQRGTFPIPKTFTFGIDINF